MRDSGVQKLVVLVHGLWFRRWALAYLARRLRKAGFRTKGFNYATTTQDLGRQVEKLYRFASMPDGDMPHFVGHSMGGLLTLQLLDRHPQTPSGRIVLLGSPIRGSSVARQISAWPGGRSLLGEAENTLVEGIRSWPLRREIGMIAGNRSLGLGLLAGGGRGHGDGTVLAEESRHDALDDRIELAVTHTGMLFSAEVARQVAAFLRDGCFDHGS